SLQIGQGGWSDATRREDVVGHAVRVERRSARTGTRKGRAADRGSRRPSRNAPDRRVGDDVERANQARDRQVVQEDLGQAGRAELVVSVVGDTLQDVALDAADHTPCGVLEVVLASPAFDVAAADVSDGASNA